MATTDGAENAGIWRAALMPTQVTLWQRIVVWCFAIVGGLIGGGFCGGFVTYPLSHKLRIGGFPIPAYVWQRSDSLGWVDFVGPATIPIMALDFLFGFFVSGAIVYWLASKCARRVALRAGGTAALSSSAHLTPDLRDS